MTKHSQLARAGLLVTAAAALAACGPVGAPGPRPALKDAFSRDFLVGAAINAEQIFARDSLGIALLRTHFNSVTPENILKWERVHPEPGRYDFGPADAFVSLGEQHRFNIIGHTLVWHSQLPRWVHTNADGTAVSRDTLIGRMRDHIHTVVGRYRGRIHGWDVVNEALNEDGTLRPSPWLRIIGPEYLEMAFRFAHEADPDAELYYNDYSLANPAKRDGAVRLVNAVKAAGVRIDGIGTQEHNQLDWPSTALMDSMFNAFKTTGLRVHITELDVDVLPRALRANTADVGQRAAANPALNPYAGGLPDSMQVVLANRYRELFQVYRRHADVIDRVTFWGVSDGDSWLNGWPVPGRTNYPLLLDRQGQPKPAYDAVVETARTRVW